MTPVNSILNENSLVGAFEQKIDVYQRLLEQDRPVASTKSTAAAALANQGTPSVAIAQWKFYV